MKRVLAPQLWLRRDPHLSAQKTLIRLRKPAWRPGKVELKRGAGGECLISSEGSPSFGGPVCLLSFCLSASARDSRVSPTPRQPIWLKKTVAARSAVALSASVVGNATQLHYASILRQIVPFCIDCGTILNRFRVDPGTTWV